jgi:DNA sulfur modification protein DndC
VEDFTLFLAPSLGFPTQNLIDIYGFEEDEELNIRTGCCGCMLVEKDRAMERIISLPEWSYMAPLRKLKPVYTELLKPYNRLRKNEKPKKQPQPKAKPVKLDMSLGWDELREQVKKLPKPKRKRSGWEGQRLGPLVMEARLWGLSQVLAIQEEINTKARELGRPEMWLITEEEELRIRELISLNTWPDGWTGDEPRGDVALDKIIDDNIIWPVLM